MAVCRPSARHEHVLEEVRGVVGRCRRQDDRPLVPARRLRVGRVERLGHRPPELRRESTAQALDRQRGPRPRAPSSTANRENHSDSVRETMLGARRRLKGSLNSGLLARPGQPLLARCELGEEADLRRVGYRGFEVRPIGGVIRRGHLDERPDALALVEQAHVRVVGPLRQRADELAVAASRRDRVRDRCDADAAPTTSVRRGRHSEAHGIGRQGAREVGHDHVVVAVADEQHDVPAEHGMQEPGGPRLGQVGVAEVSVGDDQEPRDAAEPTRGGRQSRRSRCPVEGRARRTPSAFPEAAAIDVERCRS